MIDYCLLLISSNIIWRDLPKYCEIAYIVYSYFCPNDLLFIIDKL